MNFFGHAVLANDQNRHPSFVLGSMLPDFESMARARVMHAESLTLNRGIAFHHATDSAFHRSSTFIKLCSAAFSLMTTDDVKRGTARAVAHVGTEMLLDGRLAKEVGNTEAFMHALTHGVTGAGILWSDDGKAFTDLHRRLTHWGNPADYADPSFVFARLRDALDHRPRLAIDEPDSDGVQKGIAALYDLVEQHWASLVAEPRQTLRSFDAGIESERH